MICRPLCVWLKNASIQEELLSKYLDMCLKQNEDPKFDLAARICRSLNSHPTFLAPPSSPAQHSLLPDHIVDLGGQFVYDLAEYCSAHSLLQSDLNYMGIYASFFWFVTEGHVSYSSNPSMDIALLCWLWNVRAEDLLGFSPTPFVTWNHDLIKDMLRRNPRDPDDDVVMPHADCPNIYTLGIARKPMPK